ncbi:MAG: metallophosphoesterase [Deltaproteobacteria bacterium]|nr:metallophosphoesterase [Deltaproteobacteria bacterium]
MRITLLSDLHLRGIGDPSQRDLVRLLDSHPSPVWVFAGDTFDLWWGREGAVHAGLVPALAAMRRRIEAGDAVFLVPGNHDFHRLDVLEGAIGARVVDPWRGESGGRALLALHGHQAWRPLSQRVFDRVVRSPIAAGVMAALGSRRGQRLAAGIARTRMGQRAVPLGPILEAQEALARSLRGEAEVVFVGHSHAPGTVDLGDGGLLVNLGDWVSHRSMAVVEGGEVSLLRWRDGALSPLRGPPARR